MLMIKNLIIFILFSYLNHALSNNFINNILIDKTRRTIDKIDEYTNWLLDSSPFLLNERHLFENKTYPERNGRQCLEMFFNVPSDILFFQDHFLHNFNNRIGMSIRFRNHSMIEFESFYCNFFILVHLNSISIFDDIRFFGTIKKSQYFVVVVPEEPLTNDLSLSEELLDIQKWPVDVFTHVYVAVVINRQIYRLTHPYRVDERKFIQLNESSFKTWNWVVKREFKHFNGKHLKVASINCPPLLIWDSNLRPNKSNYPSAGDIETACKDDQFDLSNCCECNRIFYFEFFFSKS